MNENRTVANQETVDDFIDGLSDVSQQNDSRTLLDIFRRVTGRSPVMWGSAIIGFGSVSLTYASGRKVDWLRAGFSPRKGKLSLYVTFDAANLTKKFPDLGKYKIGKGCIYVRRLSDVDSSELEKLIRSAWEAGYEQPRRDDGKEQAVSVELK